MIMKAPVLGKLIGTPVLNLEYHSTNKRVLKLKSNQSELNRTTEMIG
jgi:hypothetical protein